MSIVRPFFATLLAFVSPGLLAGSAASEEINPLVRERITLTQSQPDRRPHQVRVQVGINFFVPGPTNEGEESMKIRDRARRAVYQMAGRECGLLEDTIAADCRLESLTINLNRQMGQQVEGFIAQGQLGLLITPK